MDPRIKTLLEPKQYGKSKKTLPAKAGNSFTNSTSDPATVASLPDRAGKDSMSLPTYDPRALLNPKGGRNQQKQTATPQRSTQTSASKALQSSSHNVPSLQRNNTAPRSMIESLYGIEQRTERPTKRIKTSSNEEEDKSKSKSSAPRASSGIVGEYMRPSEDELKATTVRDLVDLTHDDDGSDDDIKVVKTVNVADEQEICYGMIHSTIQAYATPKPSDQVKYTLANQWPLIKCTFVRTKAENTIIEVKDPHNFTFGRLVAETANVLAPIMDGFCRIRAQARLSNRPKRSDEWPHQACSGQMKVMFNLYGRRGDVEKIGRVLGQHNIWLRTPYGVDGGTPIVNPHDHHKAVVAQNTVSRAGHTYLSDTRTVEEAAEAVTKLFDHFANTAKPLTESDPPAVVTSVLLPHQKQALTFMMTKESPRTYGDREEDNSSLWRKKIRGNGTVVYEEVVSGVHIKDEPEQVYGGLLADVMGLGKTLEALSLIATTREEAHHFGQRSLNRDFADEVVLVTQSRATLIVAPLSTVKNWEDQITEHINPGSIKYCVYHGPGREKDCKKLADHDVVISTYGTISAECSKKRSTLSPIQQIRWFRIILDEAHTIREPKAAQSQAIYSLSANRRWALTGTPIQNRMDDLGSLTKFLRLYPYDTTMRFTQYIKAPAQSKDPNSFKALRIFIDSFTLRRLKDRIDLPPKQDLVEKLDFTADEQRLHDYFKSISRSQVQEIETNRVPRGKSSGMQHSQVLRGIMTLRLISAHGRELLNEADLERLKGQVPSEAIDVDDIDNVPTITERSAYETLSMLADAGLDLCKNCDKPVNEDPAGLEESSTRAYVLPCYDVVCSECFEAYKKDFDTMHDQQRLVCPFCSLPVTAQYIPINKSLDDLPEFPPDAVKEFKRGDYGGLHTKTRALLRDLYEMQQDSHDLEAKGEPPIKCVVFSEFTSHLNLIERALSDHGWHFVRIDGTMSLAKRKRVLDELNTNHKIKILLASIKAAGQGLNLTAASRAFIMEPLWNPAAEAQAVDRIYRIGQKREVLVKRYQMNQSIELKIVQLQIKKQKLADISMNKNHLALSKKETREEHMKDLLDLFK